MARCRHPRSRAIAPRVPIVCARPQTSPVRPWIASLSRRARARDRGRRAASRYAQAVQHARATVSSSELVEEREALLSHPRRPARGSGDMRRAAECAQCVPGHRLGRRQPRVAEQTLEPAHAPRPGRPSPRAARARSRSPARARSSPCGRPSERAAEVVVSATRCPALAPADFPARGSPRQRR